MSVSTNPLSNSTELALVEAQAFSEAYTSANIQANGIDRIVMDVLNTECGNARRLLDAFGSDIRFHVEKDCWMVWTQTHWTFDSKGRQVSLLMKQVIQEMRNEAESLLEKLAPQVAEIEKERTAAAATAPGKVKPDYTSEQAKVINQFKAAGANWDWSKKSESNAVVNGSVNQAASDPHKDVRVHTEDLDKNLLLFNVLNGTYDLATNTLRPHRRGDLITKVAPVEYNPTSTCPGFHNYMNGTFEKAQDALAIIEFIQRNLGYTLTGLTTVRILTFLMGGGSNGKSVLMNIMLGIFGAAKDGYAMEAAFTSFTLGRNSDPDKPRNDLMRFEGKRLITASESDDPNAKLDTALLKRISGNDNLSGRANYNEDKQFKPQAKIFLRLNDEIRVLDNTDSFWQRMKKVPFDNQFLEGDPRCDTSLTEKLLATEASGILNWLIEGWKLVQASLANRENPIPAPPEITNETEAYRQNQSQIARFFHDTYQVPVPKHECEPLLCTAVYKKYEDWCGKNGEKFKKTSTAFGTELGKQLAKYGVTKGPHGIKRQAYWFGFEPAGTDPGPSTGQPGDQVGF